MRQKEEINKVFDIPVAHRTYLDNSKSKFYRKLLLIFPILLFVFPFIGLKKFFNKNLTLISDSERGNLIDNNHDHRILGHLPYNQISKDKLVVIEPNISVHIDMKESLLQMRRAAKNEGVFLVFLSGYRSINLQKDIFYSLKSSRNQIASERARVSAPPGYSEHSTGFAIDIGDATRRETDFDVEFENTNAFKWLKMNAARYHFKLSFKKNNKYIDYEPWHWRYEGSIEALKVFETSNRKLKKKDID